MKEDTPMEIVMVVLGIALVLTFGIWVLIYLGS